MVLVLFVAAACHFLGGLALLGGMLTRRQGWLRLGTGLFVVVTVIVLGRALAEPQALRTLLHSHVRHNFK